MVEFLHLLRVYATKACTHSNTLKARADKLGQRSGKIEARMAANLHTASLLLRESADRLQSEKARADAAERDARRYRWLRENCGYSGSGNHTGAQVIVYYANAGDGKHGIAYTGPKQRVGIMALDAAIDAAIGATHD